MDQETLRTLIPFLTILFSVAGSAIVSHKSILKSKASERVETLRLELARVFALGNVLPEGLSHKEFYDMRKEMVAVQLLLNPNDVEQGKLLKQVYNYTTFLFNEEGKSENNEFTKTYTAMLMQAYIVLENEQRKINKPFWER
ncbi:MAG TPA: hypothetical protein VL092_06035 [Chitinophagaceae bacterium]|nr:hypothetical protein [Chitinophagaceae bacterium]